MTLIYHPGPDDPPKTHRQILPGTRLYIVSLPYGEIRETGIWRVDLLLNGLNAGTFAVSLE
jgi:hypothetical protein